MASSPQHEPTMEEILASIRKIISEDSTEAAQPCAAAAAPPPAREPAPAEPEVDVLELTQEMPEEPTPPPPSRPVAPITPPRAETMTSCFSRLRSRHRGRRQHPPPMTTFSRTRPARRSTIRSRISQTRTEAPEPAPRAAAATVQAAVDGKYRRSGVRTRRDQCRRPAAP